ncbi:MAG: hypothetical protein JWQ27_2848 [Ferruginibacter sp.]|nr:hypothetical protein [Ferruginibacter sp.]
MRRFLIKLCLFLLPVFLLLVGIECYILFYPSTFNTKPAYLRKNAGAIEALVLGSSHNQNAINPEFLHIPTANLANAGQDVQLDSALFFKTVATLPALKLLILEMDYHTMEEKNDAAYFRLPWYKRFYDVELAPVSLLNRISIYSSEPSFFNKLLIDEMNPRKLRYKLNKFGFILNDFPGVMEDLDYDTLALAKTSAERLKDKHTINSPENFAFNRRKLDAIIRYALSHNLKLLVMSTPMYSTYIANEIAEKNMRRRHYIDSLKTLPNLTYADFEQSSRFDVHDFKNDDHLNSTGAKKFSMMVDSLMLEMIKPKQ